MDKVFGMVDEKRSVQVIDLVFEYLCQEAAAAALEPSAVGAARTHGDALVPESRAVRAADREAPFVRARAPAGGLYDLGVDIRFRFRRHRDASFRGGYGGKGAVLAHDKEAVRDTYLRGGERDAVRLPVKGLFHAGDKARELRAAEEFFRYGLRRPAQHRRTVLHDFFHVVQYIRKSARRMLRGIELPPEALAEVLRLATGAFQIIEVGGRYLLEYGAEVRHRHGREPVLLAGIVQVAKEKTHELAAFGEALSPFGRRRRFLLKIRQYLADGFHEISIAPRPFSSTRYSHRASGGAARYPHSRD